MKKIEAIEPPPVKVQLTNVCQWFIADIGLIISCRIIMQGSLLEHPLYVCRES